jgi:serine/threonine-protein kinase
MSLPRIVDLRSHATPADAGTPAPPPDDVVAEAADRLRTACLVWVALWTIGLIMNHLVRPWFSLRADLALQWPPIADAFAAIYILLSLALYWYAPRIRGDPERLINLGLTFEVLLAFGIGIVNQWTPLVLGGRLSWLCVLVLVHPMIVPGPPGKTLIASLLAASMDPVGLVIARARGLEIPTWGLLVWAYLPNYICAGLAVLPARVIARLSRKVSRARELGSYRLGELIGRGGMGEVWHAHHRLLARPAAIKLIRTDHIAGSSPAAVSTAIERFRREAEAVASLRSPHTVQLYDFGVTRDRRLYLVMELLDGIDLESLVRRFGPLPPARVVHLLRQACRSLAEAHAVGLVHRDIKPANLHVCRLGLEYDFLKVLDFGLVKGGAGGGASPLLTAPDLTPGTPAYMSPEMAAGEPVDGRADLYSLGCVAYWLLTGSLVFQADHPLRMVLQHLQSPPPSPSLRSAHTIPPALDALILDCLAKSPAARPAGAAELAAALDAIQLSDEWSVLDAREWWETNLGAAGPVDRVSAELALTVSPDLPGSA